MFGRVSSGVLYMGGIAAGFFPGTDKVLRIYAPLLRVLASSQRGTFFVKHVSLLSPGSKASLRFYIA